jgi:hypothetical protein
MPPLFFAFSLEKPGPPFRQSGIIFLPNPAKSAVDRQFLPGHFFRRERWVGKIFLAAGKSMFKRW